MVSTVRPLSSKRYKPVSGDFTIRFAPGQPATNQVFNTVEDVVVFIRSQTDSAITVYVDLTAVGGVFLMPTSLPPDPATGKTTYDFRRVFLDGFFNDDGTIPILIWPEGAKIDDDCDFIRKKDVDFECTATSSIVWTPNRTARMEDETSAGYLATNNSVPFVSTENGCDLLTYQGGPGCGLLNFGGSELVFIDDSTTLRIFARQTCELYAETIASTAMSTVDIRLSPEAELGLQPLNLSSSTSIVGIEQSGPTFPALTYPGKLFLKTPENRYYMRNQTNTAWVQLSVPPTVFSNNVVAAATNIFIPYVSGSYNFEQVRPHKITVSWLWALTQTSKDFWGQVRIGGAPVGISDGLNTLVLKSQPFKAGAAPTWAQIAPGLYEIEYTPPTTGSQTIDFRFRASDNTATAYVQGATITIEEVL